MTSGRCTNLWKSVSGVASEEELLRHPVVILACLRERDAMVKILRSRVHEGA